MRLYSQILLLTMLVSLGVACNRKEQRKFDVQKELISLGVGVHKLSINPAMVTPFLNDANSEELALKTFLEKIQNVNIYNIPSQRVLDEISVKALNFGYVQEVDLVQGVHRMLVYILINKQEQISSLVILLSQTDSTYYAIEMNGLVDKNRLARLNQVSPLFLETYIKRFNVRF